MYTACALEVKLTIELYGGTLTHSKHYSQDMRIIISDFLKIEYSFLEKLKSSNIIFK